MGPCFRRDDARGFKPSNNRKHSFAISPRLSREFFRKLAAPEIQRAQGMPGARRARSLACNVKKAYEHSHHGHTGNRPAFPAQWFYGLLRALPGVRILGCHRHWRIKVCQSPVGMTRLRQFSTSNGCQDHTTSPSASAPFVSAPEFAHGVDPALLIPCAPDGAASTASRPAFVTTRDPPLCVGRDGGGY